MYKAFTLVLLVSIVGMHSCTPVRPIFISPSPTPVFHKQSGNVGLGLIPIGEKTDSWIFGEFNQMKKQNIAKDWGLITHLANGYSLSSTNLLVYTRKWFKTTDAENPWGNIYGGIQFNINRYERNGKLYTPIHLEMGFAPGIYRKQYNIAFPIRLGIGSTFANNSVYFYLGPCTQLAFNITSKIILQSQLNFTFGFGGSDNTIIYLPIPSLLTLGLYYKF